MNAVVEEANKNVTELRAPGPGERLRSARLAAGLEISKIAAQLHLKEVVVHALERDDYQSMPNRVFVRGYLRNYARLVGVPAESITKQFDEQVPDDTKDRKLNRVGMNVKREVRASYSASPMVFLPVLFVAAIGAALVWWMGYLSGPGGDSSAVVADEQLNPAASQNVRTDGQLNLPAPASTAGKMAPTTGDELHQATGVGAVSGKDAGDVGRTVALSGSLLPPPAAGPVASGQQRIASSSAISGSPIASRNSQRPKYGVESSPSLSALPAPPGIVLQFDGPCWVDIRDVKRKFKLFGEMSKGTRKVLGGTPPYDVVFGNASVVKVSVNGVPYDVTRYARGNVARFVLDPNKSI